MVNVRITFKSEIYIKGNSLAEIEHQFEAMPLFSPEALEHSAEFVSYDYIEGINTQKEYDWEFDVDKTILDKEDEGVRIVFRSEIYFKAKDLEQAREDWESMTLFSKDAEEHGVDFMEIITIDDAETDLSIRDEDWYNAGLIALTRKNLSI